MTANQALVNQNINKDFNFEMKSLTNMFISNILKIAILGDGNIETKFNFEKQNNSSILLIVNGHLFDFALITKDVFCNLIYLSFYKLAKNFLFESNTLTIESIKYLSFTAIYFQIDKNQLNSNIEILNFDKIYFVCFLLICILVFSINKIYFYIKNIVSNNENEKTTNLLTLIKCLSLKAKFEVFKLILNFSACFSFIFYIIYYKLKIKNSNNNESNYNFPLIIMIMILTTSAFIFAHGASMFNLIFYSIKKQFSINKRLKRFTFKLNDKKFFNFKEKEKFGKYNSYYNYENKREDQENEQEEDTFVVSI